MVVGPDSVDSTVEGTPASLGRGAADVGCGGGCWLYFRLVGW
jgi:hypothetical protein